MLDKFDEYILLKKITKIFVDSGIYLKLGIELEFYVESGESLESIKESLSKIKLAIHVKPETGPNQYEISIAPSIDIINYLKLVNQIRDILEINNAKFDVIYKKNYPPNSVHINLNFVNKKLDNLFTRKGDKYNKFVKYSLGGLCALMSESMIFFLPKNEDYYRFGYYAPKNVSWGGNNRTTSLRLPENISENFRIEHRIISPKANLFKVISVMLLSIYYGTKNKLQPPEKIYDLADKRIDIDLLPKSFGQSLKIYEKSGILKKMIEEFS